MKKTAIKLLSALLLPVLAGCSVIRPMTPTDPALPAEGTETGWTDAYASYLEAYEPGPQEEGEEPDPVFTLIWLDEDEIPELAVADGEEPWDPVRLVRFDEVSGEAEEVGEYSMYGQMYYIERTGYFLPMYYVAPMGGDVLLLRDGEAEAFESWSYYDGIPTVNGEETSEEDFHAVSERWVSADWTAVFEETGTWRLDETEDFRSVLKAAAKQNKPGKTD